MPWYQISVRCGAARANKLAGRMEALGAAAVSFVDAADVPVLEPPIGKAVLWGSTCVQGLFEAAPRQVHALSEGLGTLETDEELAVSVIEDRDWVSETQALCEPMHFGNGLWIVPSGHGVPGGARGIVALDAGVAFGTGSHPTTRLCLEWLACQALEGKHVLDFGCGSGVLALAALKLGAKSAVLIDIDRQAVEAARANAERNAVAHRARFGEPSDLPHLLESTGNVEVLVANILLEPLLELSGNLLAALAPGGAVCLSGTLEDQASRLEQTYGPHLSCTEVAALAGWSRLTGAVRH